MVKKLLCCDALGWPVQRIKGRPFINLIRFLLHTRRIKWVEVE